MGFDKLKKYLRVLRKDIINGYSDNKKSINSKQERKLLNKKEKNVSQLESSMFHYNEILRKYAVLAKKLGLDNSLEICVLFTYLLWNGYFSITKSNVYNDNNLAAIEGAFSFDIMTGKGVCLNFSCMLRDFLIECGYNAANLLNIDNKNKVINYKPPIKRSFVKSKNDDKPFFYSLIKKMMAKKYGNHVFALIREGKYIYAYDPTNLLLLNLKNINVANLVNGVGEFKLKPYISHANNLPIESRRLLKRFYNMSRFENPYCEEYFSEMFDDLVNHLDKNKKTLKKYYEWSLENIKVVAGTAKEYQSRKQK